MTHVLVVDDEAGMRFMLEEALTSADVSVTAVDGVAAALRVLDAEDARMVDVVLTDLSMPGEDGMALLRRVRQGHPDVPVIVLTAHGNERAAVAAMKAGAHDYLPKPVGVEELRLVVARAAELSLLRRDARMASVERALASTGQSLVGQSAAWRRTLDQVGRVAARDVPVLLLGATGTGKELLATLLHQQSARREGPCIRFNCAALSAELAEAELFGHERGAFTGATSARAGFFARAHHGTLVLDEVAELSVAVQAKLLRALQDGEIQPVGGVPRRVDVRVVASTCQDLLGAVSQGRFRQDLYYRLAVVTVPVPDLAARATDIPLLAHAFCRKHAARLGLDDARLSQPLVDALQARAWPGNVRELESTVVRMLALSEGGELDASALQGATPVAAGTQQEPRGLRERVHAFERGLLVDALGVHANNHSAMARALGMTRVTLLDKLRRHGLR